MSPYFCHIFCKLFGHKWHKREVIGFCCRCGESNPTSGYKGTIKPWVQKTEDGDILIEWVTKDCRFGITLGKDISADESGWYYISRCKHLLNGNGPLPKELFEKAATGPEFLNPSSNQKEEKDV